MASPSLDHVIVQLDLDRVQSYTGPSSSTCYIYRLDRRLPFNWPRPLGPDRLPHRKSKETKVEPFDLSSERSGTTQTPFSPSAFHPFIFLFLVRFFVVPFSPKIVETRRYMAGVEGTKMKEPPAAEGSRRHFPCGQGEERHGNNKVAEKVQ